MGLLGDHRPVCRRAASSTALQGPAAGFPASGVRVWWGVRPPACLASLPSAGSVSQGPAAGAVGLMNRVWPAARPAAFLTSPLSAGSESSASLHSGTRRRLLMAGSLLAAAGAVSLPSAGASSTSRLLLKGVCSETGLPLPGSRSGFAEVKRASGGSCLNGECAGARGLLRRRSVHWPGAVGVAQLGTGVRRLPGAPSGVSSARHAAAAPVADGSVHLRSLTCRVSFTVGHIRFLVGISVM